MRRSPFFSLILLAVLLSACAHLSHSLILPPARRIPTPGAAASPTGIPPPTFIPTIMPASTSTLAPAHPSLPGPYQTSLLNPLDLPHTYIQDTCQYLHDKWSPANSAPGTVVMVIMFHRITDGIITDPNQISTYNFRQLMSALHREGFQAITTLQLDGFLEHNSRIPQYSVLLVTDDKHTANYFNVLFRPYWAEYDWPVVNAWISDDLTTAALWKQQEDLNAEGWVDYQAHGVVSAPITQASTDGYILGELKGSIDVFQEHFNKTPIAFIWPGGGFTSHAVALARQLGYRLGFTVNPRGPLMFNWVPLADSLDPKRATWFPEGPANDPLMLLPRYWDTDASLHLHDVIQIGQAAAAYAQANKFTELAYYDTICFPAYGAIP
ncbi:MAG: polysaccharide deacetylase family protein [Anaerolineales bacterium]